MVLPNHGFVDVTKDYLKLAFFDNQRSLVGITTLTFRLLLAPLFANLAWARWGALYGVLTYLFVAFGVCPFAFDALKITKVAGFGHLNLLDDNALTEHYYTFMKCVLRILTARSSTVEGEGEKSCLDC